MSNATNDQLLHLAPAAARLGRVFYRPRAVAAAGIIALAALGWGYLGLQLAAMPGAELGPGGGILDWLPRAIEQLCSASFGRGGAGMPAGPWSMADAGLVWMMWCAMALAMMVPSAGPMIYSYAEIADTAMRQHQSVVSPFILTAGYVVVWLGFAAAATAAHWMLARAALVNPSMASVSMLFSGAIFIAAGAYQFSAMKRSCLTQCQQPFPFFFANWTTTASGVFRLGWRQGLYCLGCCWALMALMFAVGAMNVVWMAGLGIVMAVEKMTSTTRFSNYLGVALIGGGVSLVIAAMVSHWPAHPV